MAFSGPAVDPNEKTVFVGSFDKSIYCLNASGSLLWRFRTTGPIAAPVTLGSYDWLWVGGTDGRVYALAKRTGSLVWSFRTGGWVWGAPAISNTGGTVYVACSDWRIYALDYASGALLWVSVPLGGELWGSPAVTKWGTVIIGSLNGGVYALNGTNGGAVLWSYATTSPEGSHGAITASPCLSDDGSVVYVGSSDTRIYTLNTTTMDDSQRLVRLPAKTNGPITSSPRVNPVTGDVIVGSGDGVVYAFPTPQSDGNTVPTDTRRLDYLTAFAVGGAGSSSPIATFTTAGAIASTPAFNATSGGILIGSDDGNVYALDADLRPIATLPLGAPVTAAPAIGPGGRVYATSNAGAMVAFDITPGPTEAFPAR